jgi:hypothetical protein
MKPIGLFFPLILLSIFSMVSVQAQTGKDDTIQVVYPDAVFDTGFTVRYSYNWDRDYSSGDILILHLRKPDPQYPALFRESVSLSQVLNADSLFVPDSAAASAIEAMEQEWSEFGLQLEVRKKGTVSVNGSECAYFHAGLSRLSREILCVLIPVKGKVYQVIYTATDQTFTFFLEDLWRMIHSYEVIEK